MSQAIDSAAVEAYLLQLQDGICAELAGQEPVARFHEDRWERPGGGWATAPRVIFSVYSSAPPRYWDTVRMSSFMRSSPAAFGG